MFMLEYTNILQNQMQTTLSSSTSTQKLFKKSSVQTQIGSRRSQFDIKTKSPQQEISQLKYAAHQSFLQVIQMESLHQEELQAVKSQFSQMAQGFKLRQSELLKKVSHLQKQIKAHQLHYIQMKEISLDIQPENLTVEAISQCFSEQSQDLSDIIKMMSGSQKKDLSGFYSSLFKDLSKYINFAKAQEIAKKFTDKLQQYIDQHCIKFIENFEKTNIWKGKYQELSNQYQILQSKFQYSQKEYEHLKQHLKKINTNKIQLEEKTFELKWKLSHLQNEVKAKSQLKEKFYSSDYNPIFSSKSNHDDADNSLQQEMKQINAQIKNIVKANSKIKRLNTFSCNTSTPSDTQPKTQRKKGSEITKCNDENNIQ